MSIADGKHQDTQCGVEFISKNQKFNICCYFGAQHKQSIQFVLANVHQWQISGEQMEIVYACLHV